MNILSTACSSLYNTPLLLVSFSSSLSPHLPLSISPSLSLLTLHQLLLLLLQTQSGESPHPPAQTETKGLIRLLNTAPSLHPSLHALPWRQRGFQEKTRPGLGLKSRTGPVKEREESGGGEEEDGGWNDWG